MMRANNSGTPLNSMYSMYSSPRRGTRNRRPAALSEEDGGNINSQNKKNSIKSSATNTPIVAPSIAIRRAKWKRPKCCTEFQDAAMFYKFSKADMGKNSTEMPSIPIELNIEAWYQACCSVN
jgi:hypothetical protein